MNRIRSIKPEIRRNRKIADCGMVASHLSRDLITFADDQGRFRADVREVKAECFPYFDGLKLTEVEKALQALASPAVGFVELYEVAGERYGWMPGWFRHQLLKTDRVSWSELPPPPGFDPQMMSKSLCARWLHDAANGDLPPRGDGSIAPPNGLRSGAASDPNVSVLETDRNHTGAGAEADVSDLDPSGSARATRAYAGADRTGGERNGPERTGGEQREAPTVTPLPLSTEAAGRVAALEDGCLEILAARPLKGFERDLVLGWASTLRRGGQLVPLEEILAVVRRKMAQPTADGSLPANLKWCADDVAALAREPATSAATLPRSVRESMSYHDQLSELEERLRQEGR